MREALIGDGAAVPARLDRALLEYLEALSLDNVSEVSIDAVAHAAGVSRASAYRHFGDRDGLLFKAAMELTRQHAGVVMGALSPGASVASKVEEAFAYSARQARVDKVLRLLLLTRRPQAIDDATRALSQEIMGPVYRQGQLDGEVRDDLSVEEIIAWLSEQRHVLGRLQLDEEQARRWVRNFIVPVLRPQDDPLSTAPEVTAVLASMEARVLALHDVVSRARSSL
jgi:AcrR family transcriptional regulator